MNEFNKNILKKNLLLAKQNSKDNDIISIKERIVECCCNLDDFHKKLISDKLIHNDYLSIERLLQILINRGIELAKQLVKFLNKPIRASGYENFKALNDLSLITNEELKEWQSMIGLRNILVHEYLNIDRAIIVSVLKKQLYKHVQNFCKKMLSKINFD